MEVRVTSLSRKILYKFSNDRQKNIFLSGNIKQEISEAIGRDVDRIDILNVSNVVIYRDDQILQRVGMVLNVTIIIHPKARRIPDHISTVDHDMINDQMEDQPRVMMSCGHAITPETLYEYCWNQLLQGYLKFTCPAVTRAENTQIETCRSVWTLYEINIKARLSNDERVLFEMKLNQNLCKSDKSIQTCPSCGTFCERLSLKNNRVVCQICLISNRKRYEFCWKCLLPWRTESNEYCGNMSCETATGARTTQELLNRCLRKQIDEYQSCPVVRMCPNCTSLIEHALACKHMTCNCGHQFCFVCLGTWGRECTHYRTCKVAPVQRL